MNEAKKLFEQVQANRRKLDSCKLHKFSIDKTPNKKYDKKDECENCGGEVDSVRKMWYETGYEHAKGDEVKV